MPKKKESKPIGRPAGETFWGEATVKGTISAPKRFFETWKGNERFKLLVKQCLDSYESELVGISDKLKEEDAGDVSLL